MRPAALEAQGLAHALREHVAPFERRTGLSITVDVGSDPALPELVEQAFFRIAQEVLANIGRHAHAHNVQVALRGRAPVRLVIADDGQDFQPASVGFITGDRHPDPDTLAAFRKTFLADLKDLFVPVLLLAQVAGVLKLGTLRLDGTKIHADAAKRKAVSYPHLLALAAHLQAEVEELSALSEQA